MLIAVERTLLNLKLLLPKCFVRCTRVHVKTTWRDVPSCALPSTREDGSLWPLEPSGCQGLGGGIRGRCHPPGTLKRVMFPISLPEACGTGGNPGSYNKVIGISTVTFIALRVFLEQRTSYCTAVSFWHFKKLQLKIIS